MKAYIKGIEIQIDKDDSWRIEKYKYQIQLNHYRTDKIYFGRRIYLENNKYNTVYLHREIMNTPKGLVCDHINGDTLDNRKYNLRNCTNSENIMNAKKPNTNTSGYKNIYIRILKTCIRYCVKVKVKKNKCHIGSFKTIEEAISERNKALIKYHGRFANMD